MPHRIGRSAERDGAVRLLDVRHEQTAVVRRRGHRQADPDARARRAHRRPGRHQRGVSAIATGAVQRVPDGRGRRPRPGDPLGHRGAAGARPPAAARAGHQARRGPCTTAADDRGARVDEAFRLAGSPHRGPVFLDVPMDQFFDRADGDRADRRRPAARLEPDPDALDRGRATLAGRGPAPGARARHRRLGRRRRGGRAALRRGARHPGDHQRHGPRACPRRPPAAGHQGPRPGLRHAPTWSSSSAPRWTSGSATASSAARTAHPPPGRAPRRLPRPGRPGTPPSRPRRAGDLHPGASTGCRAALARTAAAASPTGPRGWPTLQADGARRGRARRRPAGQRGRPDPPGAASTASWCPGWPTTRW